MIELINEAKIERKRLFIIAGILLVSLLIVALILRGAKNKIVPLVSDITSCDQNSSDLCIVTFGATAPDRMVINFQLPREDYPAFHVKGLNRGVSYDYSCYVAEAVPRSAYCSGPRTPLGEYIYLEVYGDNENFLLAHGKIFVSALMVWTPGSIPATSSINDTPMATSGTGTVGPIQTNVTPLTEAASPTSTQVIATGTPRPGTAYPNPIKTTAIPFPGTAYPNP